MRTHHTADDVQAHVEALSAEHLAVLSETLLPGATYKDVAAKLNVKVGTVKSRLHRARAALSKLLEQEPTL